MTKRTILLAAVAAGAMATNADTLGFWAFRDGQPGESASTVANTSGARTYVSDPAQTTSPTNGKLPLFCADSPGRIYADGEIVCENPQSLDMRYPSREQKHGGYLDIPGVADDLSALTAYTIEFFVKLDEDFDYSPTGTNDYEFRSKTALYFASGTQICKFIAPNNYEHATTKANGLAFQVLPVSAIRKDFTVSDGAWHHMAVVYRETDTANRTGKLAFYVNYEFVAELDFANVAGENLKFRLGTGYLNEKGDNKTVTETMNGMISGLRVSDTALTAERFLTTFAVPDLSGMETAAFYAFKDGAAGEEVSSVTNSASAGLLDGVADLTRTSNGKGVGELPRFSRDVPAKRIYTDSSMRTLLTDDYQSIYFRPVNSHDCGGGVVDFADAAIAAHKLDGFTFEFFFKTPEEQTLDWRTVFSFPVLEEGTAQSDPDFAIGFANRKEVTGYNSIYFGGAGDTTTVTNTLGYGFGWHHAAIVYDKSAQRADVYIDKEKIGSVGYAFGFDNSSVPFRFGTRSWRAKTLSNAFGGYVACPRLSSRTLSATEFMAASNFTDPSFVFAIGFNEGQGKDGQAFVTKNKQPSAASATFAAHSEPLRSDYSLHTETYPQFAERETIRPGRMVRWGAFSPWRNLAGCRFLGSHYLPPGTENAIWSGTELVVPGSTAFSRNPASWTMEAFVRAEYPTDNSLLFGKAALPDQHGNPKPMPEYCWVLLLSGDGKLKLKWTERADDPGFEYTESTTEYYKEASTAESVIRTMAWHHVALSYDDAAKRFRLYVDGKQALEQTSARGLLDSCCNYHFSRINSSLGFEGWMDEIRFSSRALEPQDFVRIDNGGFAIIVR